MTKLTADELIKLALASDGYVGSIWVDPLPQGTIPNLDTDGRCIECGLQRIGHWIILNRCQCKE